LIALIPARGGSKRIPRKNIILFFNHPLLAYTIAAAINSELFERVIVSTDDEEIADTATGYGAEVIERPAELANDQATLVDVTIHALEYLGATPGKVEAFCQLMPNCPLRRSADIRAQYEVFKRERRAFQISAVPFRSVYPQWSLEMNNKGIGQWFFGEKYLTLSQELHPLVCPTGAVWWMRTREFLEQRRFYGDPFHVQLMDANSGLDIDTQEDLELAELLVRGLREKRGMSPLEPVEPGTKGARRR
jgi:CMP-N-acetylneuraminic acid synthetase